MTPFTLLPNLITLKPLVTKFFTANQNFAQLICKLENPLDDWLELTSPSYHLAYYLIHMLTWVLQIW